MFSEDSAKVSLTDTKIEEIVPADKRQSLFFYHPDIQNIGNHRYYSEGWKGYIESGANCIAKIVAKHVNSPLLWKHGIRKQENFKIADWIALDVDEGWPMSEAIERFSEFIHVIGTTKSHQIPKGSKPPCDRYRVFLKLEKSCRDFEQYRYTVQKLGSEVGADHQAFDGARMFQPCKEIVSVSCHGRLIKLEDPPPKPTYQSRTERLDERYRGRRYIPPFVQDWLNHGCPDGLRSKVCFKIGIHLGRSGFSESEIVSLIMGSPIPIEKTSKVESQVISHVRSGMRRS